MHEIQSLINGINPDSYIADTAKKIKSWKTDHFDWAYDYVYGIEKDYRLVKVGKVGCYLHGDGLAQIIHSDGLADFDDTPDYKGLLQKTNKDNPQENRQFGDDDLFHISIGQRVLKSQLIPEGKYPVYSANVFESFGRINDLLITDFDTMSVIWGIDGDWMVNTIPENTPFYPTDHCGVLRVKKPDVVHEKYLAYALLKEGERIGFSRSKRASSDRIKGIKISLPPYKDQKQIVADIEKAEAKIVGLQEKLAKFPATRDAVLKKYL